MASRRKGGEHESLDVDVEIDTATESEAGEGESLIRHSVEDRVRHGGAPCRLTAGSLAAGLLLVGAAAATLRKKATAARPDRAKIISSAAPLPVVKNRHGCHNWEVIRLDLLKNLSKDQCNEACRGRPGCTGFGLQPGHCGGDHQVGEGACYLWDGECDEGINNCWDQYRLAESDRKPATWRLSAARYGCSNWETAKIGEPTIEISAGACATKCAETDSCVGHNFQPGDCEGKQMVARGACYLWKHACEPESNPCWDLYEQFLLTELTEMSWMGSKSLKVLSEDRFQAGDVVTLQSALMSEQRTVASVGNGTLELEEAIGHDYPSGSTVTTAVKAAPTPSPLPSPTPAPTTVPTSAPTAAPTKAPTSEPTVPPIVR